MIKWDKAGPLRNSVQAQAKAMSLCHLQNIENPLTHPKCMTATSLSVTALSSFSSPPNPHINKACWDTHSEKFHAISCNPLFSRPSPKLPNQRQHLIIGYFLSPTETAYDSQCKKRIKSNLSQREVCSWWSLHPGHGHIFDLCLSLLLVIWNWVNYLATLVFGFFLYAMEIFLSTITWLRYYLQ